MIQETYQKTIKFAGEKHANQKVPGTNSNYLLHLSNVAMEVILAHKEKADFDLKYAIQVAILHDIIEDSNTEHKELVELFGLEVANGVLALTKSVLIESKEEQMIDSLKRINRERKEVWIVKIADRITNLQKPPSHWTHPKIQNYCEQAKLISKELKGKNEYLDNRLKRKISEYKVFATSE